MSDEFNHLWGMTIVELCESLARDSPQLNERVPSRVEVISALQKVYNQSLSVSCDTFKDILAVVLYPNELAEIAQQSNTLSSSCVRLLQQHSTHANGLLNYHYGCLGLRVLALSLLITFIGYSNPKFFDCFDYEQGNVDKIMRQLAAEVASSLTFKLLRHTSPPEDFWHRPTQPKCLRALMDWHGNMTDVELDDLFDLLVTERQNWFGLCFLLPDTPGWALLVLVLWVRIAPGCGTGSQPSISSLKRLYQLNDLLGRYCLAATHDPTLTMAYFNVSRWMAYKLLPEIARINPRLLPSSEDMAELPDMKKMAMRRFKAPPTPWRTTHEFVADPNGVEILAIILELITDYQRHSMELLGDICLQMTDAMFARLWVAVQSDEVLNDLSSRTDVYTFAYAVFRNSSITILQWVI
ncbi:hypothetical protein FRC12_014551 [Ceratobasidium sp. 428]|nr:hypothetical protein FRC12_014551 [Ceratobasidium sp. 428]